MIFLSLSFVSSLFGNVFEEGWLYSKTDDFELISNASKNKTKNIIEDIYEFKNALETVFSAIKRYPDPYFAFIICKDKTTLNALYKREKKDGKSLVNLSGFFGGNDEGGFAAMYAKEWRGRGSKDMVYHEYVHSLFSKSGEELPLWFNEGIAMTFQTFQVNRGTTVFGHPVYWARDYLTERADSFMPFDELFAVNHSSPEYRNHGSAHYFYATSWAFTHFCMFGREGQYKEALLNFVEADKSGDRSEETFKKLFGMSFSQMKIEMKKYLGGGRNVLQPERFNVIKLKPEELPQKYKFSLVKAKEVDVRRIVGGIFAHDKSRRQKAREILVNARISNPENVELTATMGMLEELSDNSNKAIELYEEAIAGNVGLPHPYVHLAELKLENRKKDSPENLTVKETVSFLELLFKGRSLKSSGSRLYRTVAQVYLFSDFEATEAHLAILDEGLNCMPEIMNWRVIP
ncbi:MAG: hypothetical protein JKY51_07180 [Opitutaceae bacterium]|nr:hypothetical protein [Opitutaceae bacterium]